MITVLFTNQQIFGCLKYGKVMIRKKRFPLIAFILCIIIHSPDSFSKPDTLCTELGFYWKKLQNAGESTRFQIALPRTHPVPGYGKNLWNYAVIFSDEDDFLDRIENIDIVGDTVKNHWLVLDGTFSELTYQIYQIAEIDDVPRIDMNASYPFPGTYPDSVALFLEPGRNIESDHPDIIAVADSLIGNAGDMALAAQRIATSDYIRTIPYDNADLDAVSSGTITKSWADGSLFTALETHQNRKAVCAEMARLQTALCRAAGIPARTISWVVLHVWTEVWIHDFGWLQMDKGTFPHYRPATLARLSSNNDAAWFDWMPQDTCLFRKSNFRLDAPQSLDAYPAMRLIVVKPAGLHLPVSYERRLAGLIPISPDYGAYMYLEDDTITLHILEFDNLNPAFDKSWEQAGAIDETISIDIPGFKRTFRIRSKHDWILMECTAENTAFIPADDHPHQPQQIHLYQNTPNPFNPRTQIQYAIPDGKSDNPVILTIYNNRGQRVKTLVDKIQSPGFYSVCWDGKDDRHNRVGSGTYIIRFIVGNTVIAHKKIALMR
jgi:hypothetical protein